MGRRLLRRVRWNLFGEKGFSLLEIAVVMVLIGLLAGGGIPLLRTLTERKTRNDTLAYLREVRTTLIYFAERTGRLPWADTDGDGVENPGSQSGRLPYLTLQVAPRDAYSRTLAYAVHGQLTVNRSTTCYALRAGLTGAPRVVDADGAPTALSVAAVLVSAGPMDADGDGNVFDRLAAGTHQGDNTSGNPNYLRHAPTTGFDDLTLYFTGNEIYGGVCEFLSVAVNNGSTTTVWVRDASRGLDLGSLAASSSHVFDVLSGTRIELRSTAGGGGGIVHSTPQTPISLAGKGMTIMVP